MSQPVDVTEDEVMAAIQAVKTMVEVTLRRWKMADDIDDVMQEIWLGVNASLTKGGYDPAKGELGGWVRVIARNKIADHQKRYYRTKNINEAATNAFASTFDQDQDAHPGDDSGLDRIINHDRLKEVIRLTWQASRNPEACQRAFAVMLDFGDHIPTAAQHLGVKDEILRSARRETQRLMWVIARALEAHREGKPVSTWTLLHCLPDLTEDEVTEARATGEFLHVMVLAIRRAGGFGNMSNRDLEEITDWSHNTCRQYAKTARHLLSVAYTLLVHGRFLTPEETRPGPEPPDQPATTS